MEQSRLPCGAGGKSNEGPDSPQPSPPAVGAELPHQPGFSHPGPAKKPQNTTTLKKKKKKIGDTRVGEVHIYIFHTHMWGPTISVTIQECALEAPLKAHPFLLVPSWKPSF